MSSIPPVSGEKGRAPATPDADPFDRGRMLAGLIGFLILAAVGYALIRSDLTPLQAIVVRITVALSVAGLVAAAIAMVPAISVETGLAKAVVAGGIVAAGAASYATFPVSPPRDAASASTNSAATSSVTSMGATMYCDGVMLPKGTGPHDPVSDAHLCLNHSSSPSVSRENRVICAHVSVSCRE